MMIMILTFTSEKFYAGIRQEYCSKLIGQFSIELLQDYFVLNPIGILEHTVGLLDRKKYKVIMQ